MKQISDITKKNKYIIPFAVFAIMATALTGVVSVADAASATVSQTSTSRHQQGTPPAAAGLVTAVSGNTIIMTDIKTGTTYSVDATNAVITKHAKPTTAPAARTARPIPTTITVSGITVGDMVAVNGTVNGTTITATKVQDGVFGGGRGGFGGDHGQGVMGTVTAVNGSTVTITGKDGKTYTVDATNSTVGKFQSIGVTGIQVGDSVGVQGAVNGTSVTAKNIMDGMPTPQKDAVNSSK
jgi:hypothetical protein